MLVWMVGSVGGTIFAIKWLVHSVANGLWHQDRFLWRVFVPLTGGIYALVAAARYLPSYPGLSLAGRGVWTKCLTPDQPFSWSVEFVDPKTGASERRAIRAG